MEQTLPYVDRALIGQLRVGGVDDDGQFSLKPNGRAYLFRALDPQRAHELRDSTDSATHLRLRWREQISFQSFEIDELTKFRIVHKMVNLPAADGGTLQYSRGLDTMGTGSSDTLTSGNSNDIYVDYSRTVKNWQWSESETIVWHEYRMDSPTLASGAFYDFRVRKRDRRRQMQELSKSAVHG